MAWSRWNPREKIALVTGASSGIGREITLQLLVQGATVIATARRVERLNALMHDANGSPGRLIVVAGDVCDPVHRKSLLKTAESFEKLDLLVNNAGIGAIGPFEQASPARLEQVMQVNFFAPVELTRTMLPLLNASSDAVICNISSVLGHRAVPDKSEYCASKFAMHGWTDALRAELAQSNIRVTLVSPSTTRSEFFDALVETAEGTASKSLGSWPPSRVAKATLKAIAWRRSEVILSLGGKLLVYADRICPPLMNWILRSRT
ncbi:MAG: SDR family NAD(P)-dependent oxidoreductase [Planctomycetota bacterium]